MATAGQGKHDPRFWVVIPAAGSGRRMGPGSVPKQYLELRGRPVLAWTLSRLDTIKGLAGMVVVLEAGDRHFAGLSLHLVNPLVTTTGGSQRAQSVLNGLKALDSQAQPDDWVLVHDAVRPCVTTADIGKLCEAARFEDAGGLLAVPVNATLKQAGADQTVACTVDRQAYWLAATPQMFRYDLLRKALELGLASNIAITDEAHAMELAGHPVKLVEGRADNIKITRPEDLVLADHILQSQEKK